MEREFLIAVAEEPPGRLRLTRDGLWVAAAARSPLRGTGMCKLWLTGEAGRLFLGTLTPEGGWLTLRRRLSQNEMRRAGVWPPKGVETAVVWPFDPCAPFPRPDLFCFAQVEGDRVILRFDSGGMPKMPE